MYPKNPRPVTRAVADNTKVMTLTGEAGTPAQAAITGEDAAALGTIALKSARVSAAPTMDQHNALVADVRALAAVLNRMGARFTGL